MHNVSPCCGKAVERAFQPQISQINTDFLHYFAEAAAQGRPQSTLRLFIFDFRMPNADLEIRQPTKAD